jgi:hypothetical protein
MEREREELINELFCIPTMVQYGLQGYFLYWCRPHTAFKLVKDNPRSVQGFPLSVNDIPNCMGSEGEIMENCDNVHINQMSIDDLRLAIRVMSYMQYERGPETGSVSD